LYIVTEPEFLTQVKLIETGREQGCTPRSDTVRLCISGRGIRTLYAKGCWRR